METKSHIDDLLRLVENSLIPSGDGVRVADHARLRSTIHRLAEVAALDVVERSKAAAYLIRQAAHALGIYPASIQALYAARSRGEVPANFTVPAINLRALPFEAARVMFRVAKSLAAGAFIFEISRAEIAFTDQRPDQYAACILAAAVAEGYTGPVFLQGDHFQVSAQRYAQNPKRELQAVRALIAEAIQAGFFNIDVDASTLVDLGKTDLHEQQHLNSELTAKFTASIRALEPAGVIISVGGEIGEVGGHNSTEPELRAFMEGYIAALRRQWPGAVGLSKISIQTGTSHGGVVLPDGSIAEVKIDFETLRQLSLIAREDYGMAGAVQHGASTLPDGAFREFVRSQAAEVHLATSFTTTLFDRLPEDLKAALYAYLDDNLASERAPDMTDEQFYHRTRKYAIGPFKTQLWALAPSKKTEIGQVWEAQFRQVFTSLSLPGTREWINRTIRPALVPPRVSPLRAERRSEEDVRDLAD